MEEIFKDIKGYEGLYQISNYGRVISYPKKTRSGIREMTPDLVDVNYRYKNSINGPKYYRYALSKDGKTKKFQAHRLVAEAFIPNPDNKSQVNHIDNNGLNNYVENLEWVTPLENKQHSMRQHRHRPDKAKESFTKVTLVRQKLLRETTLKKEGTIFENKIIKHIYFKDEISADVIGADVECCSCGKIEFMKSIKQNLANKKPLPYCKECRKNKI